MRAAPARAAAAGALIERVARGRRQQRRCLSCAGLSVYARCAGETQSSGTISNRDAFYPRETVSAERPRAASHQRLVAS